jgi:hypothetical protein
MFTEVVVRVADVKCYVLYVNKVLVRLYFSVLMGRDCYFITGNSKLGIQRRILSPFRLRASDESNMLLKDLDCSCKQLRNVIAPRHTYI